MKKYMTIAAISVALSLAGCTNSNFTLEANKGQVGAGATLTMDGDTGRLRMGPTADWPKGIDQKVDVSAESKLPLQDRWEVVSEHKQRLSFVKSAAGWICTSCVYSSLPLEWQVTKRE